MNNEEITVCLKRGSSYGCSEPENPAKIAFYESDPPGVHRHPRKLGGYVWEDKNGSTIVERVDGKRVKLVLP